MTEHFTFDGRPLRCRTDMPVQSYKQIRPKLREHLHEVVNEKHLDLFWDDNETNLMITENNFGTLKSNAIIAKIKVDKAWIYDKSIREEDLGIVVMSEADKVEWKNKSRKERAQHIKELRNDEASGGNAYERNRFRLALNIEDLKKLVEDVSMSQDQTLARIKMNWGGNPERMLPTEMGDFNVEKGSPTDKEARRTFSYMFMLSEALPGQGNIVGEALCAAVRKRIAEQDSKGEDVHVHKLESKDVIRVYDDIVRSVSTG